MERSLKIKRIFALGSYQNIDIGDEVTGIPENLAMDEGFISKVSYLQLLNIERRINLYYTLREKYREATPEEAIALIEQEIAETKQAL